MATVCYKCIAWVTIIIIWNKNRKQIVVCIDEINKKWNVKRPDESVPWHYSQSNNAWNDWLPFEFGNNSQSSLMLNDLLPFENGNNSRNYFSKIISQYFESYYQMQTSIIFNINSQFQFIEIRFGNNSRKQKNNFLVSNFCFHILMKDAVRR